MWLTIVVRAYIWYSMPLKPLGGAQIDSGIVPTDLFMTRDPELDLDH
jgi:hypothetical protein